ncbi:MAG: DUF6134 family protein [Alphaproteobacteria bacterium]
MVSFFGRVALIVLLACGPAQAAVPDDGELVFDIIRNGDPIGTHRFRFERAGERVDVAIDIQIKVKVLLLTVYDYQHSNRETWENGQLVRLLTQTDDNGDPHRVDGQLTPAGFKVVSEANQHVMAEPVIPTSYWRTDTVNARQMLNTQTGELMNVTITPGSETRIKARGQEIEARHYVISGDLDLEIWYDADDVLVGLRFAGSDGSVIEYSLRPPSQTTARGG